MNTPRFAAPLAPHPAAGTSTSPPSLASQDAAPSAPPPVLRSPRTSALSQALALHTFAAPGAPRAPWPLSVEPLTRHSLLASMRRQMSPFPPGRPERTHGAELRAVAAAFCHEVAHPLPRQSSVPELDLLRVPRAWVENPPAWRTLLEAHRQPAWIESLLRRETPTTEQTQIFAQENRLRALARYLICLRAARIDCDVAERLAAVLPALLALPSIDSRHRLLLLLVGHSESPSRLQAALHAWREATGGPEAKLLALAVALVSPDLAAHPAVQAVLRARGVVVDGAVARRVLAYLLRPECGSPIHPAVEVLGWATDANLMRLLRLSMDGSSTVEMARKRFHVQGITCDRDIRAAWSDACQQDQRHHRVLMALVDDRRTRGVCDGADAELLHLALKRLVTALDVLAERAKDPQLAATAREARALCQAPVDPTRLSQDIKALNCLRHAARSHKKTPHGDWTREVLMQIQETLAALVAVQWAQVSPSSHVRSRVPQARFFADKQVRTYVNQAVVPVVLALVDHRAMLQARADLREPVDLHALAKPHDVVSACVPWFRRDDPALLDRFLREVKAPENLVAYVGSASTWSPELRAVGMPLLERLVRGALDGTYASLRASSPQMQALRQNHAHRAALKRWEAGHSQDIEAVMGTGTWCAFDTDDLGESLAAMRQVDSCQSPAHGASSHNVGNLGRLIDGSKRLAVVHDAQHKIRGRGILRLMSDPVGAPVLTLSTLYATNHAPEVKAALCGYVSRRAADLGFEAVMTTWDSVRDLRFGRPYPDPLVSLPAAVPDYYDELNGLVYGEATLQPSPHMRRL